MRDVTIWSPPNKAAAQCAADVSNARMIWSDGNRAHLCHFGDVVAQQVFDTHLQRQGRRRAACASALHVQIHHALFEAIKCDVVGRNLAVVDLPNFKFSGTFAWFIWMLVHLMLLVGFRNRAVVFVNWTWNYFRYENGNRIIVRPYRKKKSPE